MMILYFFIKATDLNNQNIENMKKIFKNKEITELDTKFLLDQLLNKKSYTSKDIINYLIVKNNESYLKNPLNKEAIEIIKNNCKKIDDDIKEIYIEILYNYYKTKNIIEYNHQSQDYIKKQANDFILQDLLLQKEILEKFCNNHISEIMNNIEGIEITHPFFLLKLLENNPLNKDLMSKKYFYTIIKKELCNQIKQIFFLNNIFRFFLLDILNARHNEHFNNFNTIVAIAKYKAHNMYYMCLDTSISNKLEDTMLLKQLKNLISNTKGITLELIIDITKPFLIEKETFAKIENSIQNNIDINKFVQISQNIPEDKKYHKFIKKNNIELENIVNIVKSQNNICIHNRALNSFINIYTYLQVFNKINTIKKDTTNTKHNKASNKKTYILTICGIIFGYGISIFVPTQWLFSNLIANPTH